MTEEQQHAIEHAQKVLRAVKLYDLATSLAPTQGADARPVTDEMIAAAIDAESKHNVYANRIKAVPFHKLPVTEQMRLRIAAAIAATAPRDKT